MMTGGGDCPGLNAVIRAVTKSAMIGHGLEVFGIEDGYEGLIQKRGHMLSSQEVSGILTHGGTILGTSNTADPFKVPVQKGNQTVFEDQSAIAIHHFNDWGLDGLVIAGGDGTLTIASKLFAKGVPVVGIPKTIDNDLPGTDCTFGYDTAINIVMDCIDRLHTTAESHNRVMVVEVMGRHAGWIALEAGLAGGADVILIPEIPLEIKKVCDLIKRRHQRGKTFSIIAVAEGFQLKDQNVTLDKKVDDFGHVHLGGIGSVISDIVEKNTGFETRVTVLGHIQRGGSPTAFDRVLGTRFGVKACELVEQKQFGYMASLAGREIRAVPLSEAVGKLKTVPEEYYRLAETFFG